MKKLKSGFTLAEVLITLAIIGVVAAIVMPSVMANYQYKSIGVKLAKFMSIVEASSRPYVVNNGNFTLESGDAFNAKGEKIDGTSKTNATDFINESFLFKAFDPVTLSKGDGESKQDVKVLAYPDLSTKKFTAYSAALLTEAGDATAPYAILKDGTSIRAYLDNTKYTSGRDEIVSPAKYGSVIFRIEFDPRVQGLPSTAQKRFNFSITELGYIFPHENDTCAWYLYNNDFNTKAKDFESGACKVTAGS